MRQRATHVAVAAAFLALSGVAGAQGGGKTAAAASGASPASAAVPASAASVPAAPAPAAPVLGQYPVHPGQSLHDIAFDLTQSHDKGVLARVSRALFDANPNAFAKHDPSHLKAGAVLNVPGVPGVVAGASGMTAASTPTVPVASTPAASAVPASAPAAASAVAGVHGASAVVAAGASTTATAATATASASAVQATPAPATAGASAAGVAATASGTGAVGAASAVATAAASGASASMAASLPASAAAPSSNAHVWSGAIEAAPTSGAASGAAPARGASASAPVPVSSLQQLLALKNRVLMALQKHGIGKAAQSPGAVSGVAANPAGTHGAAGAAQPGAAGAQPELSPVALGGAAAVGAALLALIFRLLTRKRKKNDDTAGEAPATANEPPVPDTPSHGTAAEIAPPASPAVPAEPEPPQPDETLDHATEAASLSAAAALGGDALPPTFFELSRDDAGQNGPAALSEDRAEHGVTPRGVEPGEPETLADASEAEGFAAAAEPGASAVPPESVAAAPHTVDEAGEQAHAAGQREEPPIVQEPEAPQHVEEEAPEAEAHEITTPEAAEPPAGNEAVPPAEPEVPASPVEEGKYAAVPMAFPQDAVSAMGSIDMPLPPRVPEPAATGAPLSTEPVASPKTTAAQAVPLAEPPAPAAGESIEAGTAGPGSIAGLGAPRFGVLTLDFDLNLPPDSAEPLPVFTPGQFARIARNKLELAHEYIALGDVPGARALINEVIESNDPATRDDAQALLSTLAPLS